MLVEAAGPGVPRRWLAAREWQDAALPGPCPAPLQIAHSLVSATSPLMIFPRQLLSWQCHFTKKNLTAHGPGLALSENENGRDGADEPLGVGSLEVSSSPRGSCLGNEPRRGQPAARSAWCDQEGVLWWVVVV